MEFPRKTALRAVLADPLVLLSFFFLNPHTPIEEDKLSFSCDTHDSESSIHSYRSLFLLVNREGGEYELRSTDELMSPSIVTFLPLLHLNPRLRIAHCSRGGLIFFPQQIKEHTHTYTPSHQSFNLLQGSV